MRLQHDQGCRDRLDQINRCRFHQGGHKMQCDYAWHSRHSKVGLLSYEKKTKYSLQQRIANTKGMTKEEALEMFMKRQPTGTLMAASDVANMAVYLAGDNSKFVTGGEHIIDGGWSL